MFFANRKWLFTCERLDWHFSSSAVLYQISLYFFPECSFLLDVRMKKCNCCNNFTVTCAFFF